MDSKASSGAFKGSNIEFETLLKDFEIDSAGFFGLNKTLRYEERIVEIGGEYYSSRVG